MEASALQSEPRRLHPLTLVQRLLRSLPGLLILLLPVLLQSTGNSEWFSISTVVLYGVLALPLIVLHYLRFRYWITPRELVIHSGILTRRKRSIPIENIQNIEIEQSLLPRLLGTAKVKVETAGSQQTEGVLEYVALEEAERIRQVIRRYQQGAPEETRTENLLPRAVPEPAETLLFAMPLRRVLLAGAFRFSLLYLAVIASVLQQFDVYSDAEAIARWITRQQFEPYTDVVRTSPWLAVFVGVLLTLALGWLSGILLTLNKYYGFRLWREGDKVHKRSGLLTVSEGTIPLAKVQAMLLRTNPFMRHFGWRQLELQTMGVDLDERGHQVAVPFAQLDTILDLAPRLRRFTLPAAFEPVSRLMIRRRFLRYSLALASAVGPAAWFWQPALWGLLLVPLLFGLALWQYRQHGYALHDGMLYIRSGWLRQRLWMIPVDKFQVFYTRSSFFQRRLRLATLIVDTAGASSFGYPRINDLPDDAVEALFHDLHRRFQAYFEAAPVPAASHAS